MKRKKCFGYGRFTTNTTSVFKLIPGDTEAAQSQVAALQASSNAQDKKDGLP